MPAEGRLIQCEAGEEGREVHCAVMYGTRPPPLTGGNLEGGAPWDHWALVGSGTRLIEAQSRQS